MLKLAAQIEETASAVRQQWAETPRAGIILGSGLGGVAREISAEATLDYADLPHFPGVSAMGHRGQLVCGRLDAMPVVAFEGRFHLYEGNSAAQAALPARLIAALGAEAMIVSNAAGGLNPQYAVGDVMLIEDQINLMFDNPLIGVNDDNLGPRFPDMSAPYDREFMKTAAAVARTENFPLHRGVYVSMLGPSYETRAEYRMLRRLGGDAVGMSTIPEVVAARHADLRVLGLSIISNVASPDCLLETTGHAVLQAAESAAGKALKIVRSVTRSLGEDRPT